MSITFTHLRSLNVEELVQQARDAGLDNAGNMRHAELIFELTRLLTDGGQSLIGEGVLEILADGFGFLRSPVSAFAPGADDIYVSPSQIRRFNLRTGDWVVGKSRSPREGERYFALLQIQKVNERSPEEERNRFLFETLTPVVPHVHKTLPYFSNEPIGWGDAGVIEASTASKGLTAQDAGLAFAKELGGDDFIYLGVAVKPARFHALRGLKPENVVLSQFGDLPARHLQQSGLATQRAMRLVEQGKHVTLIIDSLSTLSIAFRDDAEQQGRNGAISLAIGHIKSLFGTARNLEQGGSLTVVGLLSSDTSPLQERLKTDLFPHLDFVFQNQKRD